jgi:hypothetical protein
MTAVSSVNLDALHDSDCHHQYVARLTTPYQYMLSQVIPRDATGIDTSFLDADEKAVKNPCEKCLDNLLVLAEADARKPDNQAAQVRHFAWLALRDPAILSRERALLEIGRAARRLGLTDPVKPPEEVAGPVELSEGLVALGDALRPILQRPVPSEEERAAFDAACKKMEAFAVDLEGGRRVLRAIEGLTRGRSGEETALEPLYHLSRSVQEQVVRRVLSEAVGDPHQHVRAAAMEANWRAFGDAFLLYQLVDLERNFMRRASWRYEVEDVVRLFELVRVHGLPEPGPETSADDAAKLHYRLLLLLTNVAISVGDFDERVRAAAMRALGRVSGAGFESLRFEDWAAWWQANEPTMLPPELREGDGGP